uniref:Immunoglobulin subtype domain-containing protein n=1 Tax=Xiphophorus maculatus TaxID=8083 RepID=A0A3B5QAI1_XIPMA
MDFLAALCGAKTLIQTEGGSITAKCSFTFSGSGKFVCRDPCENGDVLIETEAAEAQKGRYSIRYTEGTFPASPTVLYVNISRLIQSDSGRYWCGLKRRFMTDSRQEFNVNRELFAYYFLMEPQLTAVFRHTIYKGVQPHPSGRNFLFCIYTAPVSAAELRHLTRSRKHHRSG